MGGMFFDGAVVGRRGRVLVVDDEALVRKPISWMLTKAGYEVVEAEDGHQAIDMLNAGDNPLVVDTILCDIRMPRLNGAQAIAYFRAEFPSISVIVLTGYPDIGLVTALMKQGIADYLLKPITKDELLAAVDRAVDQHVILDGHFVV